MITPIEMLTPISGEKKAQSAANTENANLFSDIFQSAIENVKTADANKTQAQYLLATGQLDNPASLMIASTKSELAVTMLVQLRNKALDAYSELTRINL